MMIEAELKSLTDWIQKKSRGTDYGEIHVVFKIHAGRPTILEKSVIEKTQLTGITGGTNDSHNHRS